MRLRISFPLAATAGLVTAIGLVVSISFLAWSSLHGIVKDLGEAARPDLRLVLAKDHGLQITIQRFQRVAVIDARRPQWSYVLGKSLHALQDLSGARPLLEEAVATYPPQRAVAPELRTAKRSPATPWK